MDSLSETLTFWTGYSAGVQMGGIVLVVVAICSVILFIGKLMR